MINDVEFLILNAIYLKKMGGSQEIAAICDLPLDQVQALSESYVNGGKLLETPSGFLLLAEGTQVVLDYYQEKYSSFRENPDAILWYERFETVNTRFIGFVTEWQSTNDSRDLEKLFRQIERLIKLLGELTESIPRYEQYIKRFEDGMSLVDNGDDSFVCNPRVDSVHNVWFEFHEDILAVIGRPRDTT